MNIGLMNRKRIVIVGLVLIILTFVIFIVIPAICYADAAEDEATAVNALMRLFSKEGAMEALGLNGDKELYTTIRDFANPVTKAVTGISLLWVIALMIYAVIKEFSTGNATLEMWLKVLIKIAIGIFLIVSVNKILNGIEDVGFWIVDTIHDTSAGGGGGGSHVDFDSLSYGTSAAVTLFAVLLIAYIKICSYALLIEISLRRIFASVAIGSIILKGARSPGVRYFKKFLAVYVKMAIMIATLLVGGNLVGNAGVQGLAAIALLCACTTFIGKGAKLADEIVDASA